MRRWAGSASRSTLSSPTAPVDGRSPINARRSVVLPAPLRPISPHISPSLTTSVAPRRIGMAPIDALRLETLSTGCSPGSNTLEPGAADQFLHLRIVQRLAGRSVGDDGAVVERKHPVGKTADDFHIVLLEQHGDLAALER